MWESFSALTVFLAIAAVGFVFLLISLVFGGLFEHFEFEAQGIAEATAILKKAEAWKQFNEAARLQTILEKLPAIIQATAPVFGAVAAPLGNIDKVVVIDQGNGHGQSGVSRFASNAPSVIFFGLLQQLEALGLNVPNLLSQLRVKSTTENGSAPQVQAVVETSEKEGGASE